MPPSAATSLPSGCVRHRRRQAHHRQCARCASGGWCSHGQDSSNRRAAPWPPSASHSDVQCEQHQTSTSSGCTAAGQGSWAETAGRQAEPRAGSRASTTPSAHCCQYGKVAVSIQGGAQQQRGMRLQMSTRDCCSIKLKLHIHTVSRLTLMGKGRKRKGKLKCRWALTFRSARCPAW
jgi:hypothetical protein